MPFSLKLQLRVNHIVRWKVERIAFAYGFLSFVLFLIFSLMTTINRKNLKILFFWFFLIFMYGVNSQFVWATITIMFTIKYFDQQKEFTDNLKLEN